MNPKAMYDPAQTNTVTTTADMAVVFADVWKTYGQGAAAVQALRGIDLTIHRGELVAITGPSGCGKTTLLNLIGALDKPSMGQVVVDGSRIDRIAERRLHMVRRQSVGFVFQRFYLVPMLTALENVLIPAMPINVNQAAYQKRAEKLLQSVGLGRRMAHRPGQLSGGEQQRVAVARALLLNPPILLADEPTGNLDSVSGAGVLELLLALNRDAGKTVVIVTHDAGVATRARRTVRMLDGVVESDLMTQ
jgi:putative ABC transport system ATP-binding protein